MILLIPPRSLKALHESAILCHLKVMNESKVLPFGKGTVMTLLASVLKNTCHTTEILRKMYAPHYVVIKCTL